MNWEVGDSIAFHGRGRIEIHKIEKITPTGRLVCGPYTLNSDLTVRGASWQTLLVRGKPTYKDMCKFRRQTQELRFEMTKVKDLSDDQLDRIYRILKEDSE